MLKWRYETGGDVVCVAWSPDGSLLAAGSWRYVYVFDRSGELKWRYETGGSVFSVAWSPDGKYLAAGSSDNYVFDGSGLLKWRYETGYWVRCVCWGFGGFLSVGGGGGLFVFKFIQVNCSSVFYLNGSAYNGGILVPVGVYSVSLDKYVDLGNGTRLYLIGVRINGKYFNTSKVTLNIRENTVIEPVYVREYFVDVVDLMFIREYGFVNYSCGWVRENTIIELKLNKTIVLSNSTKFIHLGWLVNSREYNSSVIRILVDKPLIIKPIFTREYLVKVLENSRVVDEKWVREGSVFILPEASEYWVFLVKYIPVYVDEYGKEYRPGSTITVTRPLVFKLIYRQDYSLLAVAVLSVMFISVLTIVKILKTREKKVIKAKTEVEVVKEYLNKLEKLYKEGKISEKTYQKLKREYEEKLRELESK